MKFSDTNTDTIKTQTTVHEIDCDGLEKRTHSKSGHDIVPRVLFTLDDTIGFTSSLTNDDKLTIRKKHSETDTTVVVFGNQTVNRKSYNSLKPKYWLTDEVINMFFFLLSKRDEKICHTQGDKRRSHFFKSFFFTQILDEHNTGTYTYENVRKWIKVSF